MLFSFLWSSKFMGFAFYSQNGTFLQCHIRVTVEQTRFGNVIKTNNRSESRLLTFNNTEMPLYFRCKLGAAVHAGQWCMWYTQKNVTSSSNKGEKNTFRPWRGKQSQFGAKCSHWHLLKELSFGFLGFGFPFIITPYKVLIPVPHMHS